MPYFQAATNNYFGFSPVYGTAPTNAYPVSSTEAGVIYAGDIVLQTTVGTVKVAPSGGLAAGMAGVAAGVGPATLTSGTVLIYDDPLTLFVGCDTTSGVIGGVGSSFYGQTQTVLTTGCVGSTGVNTSLARSVMALSGVVSTYGPGTGVFKVVGVLPIESQVVTTDTPHAAGSALSVRKYILRPSTHIRAGYSTGMITT